MFRRDREHSPVNRQARERMQVILANQREQDAETLDERQGLGMDQEGKKEDDQQEKVNDTGERSRSPYREDILQQIFGQDIKRRTNQVVEAREVVSHLVERKANEVEAEAEEEVVVVEDKGLEMLYGPRFNTRSPNNLNDPHNVSHELLSKSSNPESPSFQENHNFSIHSIHPKITGKGRNISFNNFLQQKKASQSFTKENKADLKNTIITPNSIKRLVTSSNTKGRTPLPGSLSFSEHNAHQKTPNTLLKDPKPTNIRASPSHEPSQDPSRELR